MMIKHANTPEELNTDKGKETTYLVGPPYGTGIPIEFAKSTKKIV